MLINFTHVEMIIAGDDNNTEVFLNDDVSPVIVEEDYETVKNIISRKE